MVLDPVAGRHLRADHFHEFLAQVGPVQAGGHQDQDFLARDAALLERRQSGGKMHRVGHRPGDVADDHAGIAAAPGQLGQRRSSRRLRQAAGDRRLRLGQRLGTLIAEALDHVPVGSPRPARYAHRPNDTACFPHRFKGTGAMLTLTQACRAHVARRMATCYSVVFTRGAFLPRKYWSASERKRK